MPSPARPRPEDIIYPKPDIADDLVATYFSRIHHTFPILHQQLFVERYTRVMDAHQAGKPSNDHPFLASMFAVFACGACLTARDRTRAPHAKGDTAFSGVE